MNSIFNSLTNFNIQIKGGIYLLRHFIYVSIPITLVITLQLEVHSPIKWLCVIPAMYLMCVNDYNRLFTLFKNPLPIFMIMVLVSVVCGIFPEELLWLSSLGILFRILLAFNIGNKKTENNEEIINKQNPSNMNTFFEENRQLILYVNLVLAYLIYLNLGNHLRFVDDNLIYQIGNLFEFLGGSFLLVIYVLFKKFKKQPLELLPFILILWFSMAMTHSDFILAQ